MTRTFVRFAASGILACLASCGDSFDTGQPVQTTRTTTGNMETPLSAGDDWPQWRGWNRDGVSSATGLARTWPPTGPVEVWRQALGEGYSGLAVARGRVYTLFQSDAEYVVALDAGTGEQLWQAKSDSRYTDSQGDGPRGAPVVSRGMVFTVGARGAFLALDAESGTSLWRRDLVQELGGRRPQWGYATSPLVQGDLVFVEPGGSGDRCLAAFNRDTGEPVWASYGDSAGYSSPIGVTVQGRSQIVFFTAGHVVAVSPEDGKRLWEFPWTTDYDVNAATPIFIPPDRIFVSSGYGVGGAVLRIAGEGTSWSVRPIWNNREMKNQFSSSVYFEGHLYGFDDSTLKCIAAESGEMQWRQRGFGRGSLILADRQLIILSERGVLALAEATPEAYRETARAQVLKGKCWTSPALAHGRLYLRNQQEIVCLDLRS